MDYKFDHKPMCIFCKNAKTIPYTDDMLCSKHGVVDKEHTCKKFKYNLLARQVRRKKDVDTQRFSTDDFTID